MKQVSESNCVFVSLFIIFLQLYHVKDTLSLKPAWGRILGTGGMRGVRLCLGVPPFLYSPLFSSLLWLTCCHVIASVPAALSIATSQERGEHLQHGSRGSRVCLRGRRDPALAEHTGGTEQKMDNSSYNTALWTGNLSTFLSFFFWRTRCSSLFIEELISDLKTYS